MSVIRLLPEALANQIAAGEVVQRPASVVKELLENALDAGATHLQLVLQDAGKVLIQVIDNGAGMSAADARLSFERHATSKIRQVDDLFRIGTYGFRGEALASIAAVAQVTLRTRPADAELGTQITMAGGSFVEQAQVTAPVGTSLSVRNLFYNVPARRKFLKSNPVETRHILNEFYRVALVHPDKQWALVHNGETIYDLAPSDWPTRIAQLYPFLTPDDLLPVQEGTSLVRMEGYVARPEAARKSRGEQYFFVNGRYIRDALLHHAVTQAYGELLPRESYPVYFLHLTMDPARVDVNIHPTKTEVKFEDERSLYALLQSTVRQALGKLHLAQAQAHGEAQTSPREALTWGMGQEAGPDLQRHLGLHRPAPPSDNRWTVGQQAAEARASRAAWDLLLAPLQPPTSGPPVEAPRWEPSPALLPTEAPAQLPFAPQGQELQVLQVLQRYLLVALADQLLVIDQQAAHQRVLYEQLLAATTARPLPVQQLLYPLRINYSAADGMLLEPVLPKLRLQGFDAQFMGPGALLISGVPHVVRHADVPAVFDALLAGLKAGGSSEDSTSTHELLARTVARQSAISSGRRLAPEEAARLAQDLLACRDPAHAPGGQPTYFALTATELAMRLSRRD